jgi:hypothetical protein
VVGALAALWPRTSSQVAVSSPTPSASGSTPSTVANTQAPGASPTDSHLVVTDQGEISFSLSGPALVVRRAQSGSIEELGRQALPTAFIPSPGATLEPSVSAIFVLVCGPAEGPDSRRFVFGHLGGTQIVYEGPTAVGHGARDGLFLFALAPGTIDTSTTIRVQASDGSFVQAGGDAFASAVAQGTLQPSGCRVLG